MCPSNGLGIKLYLDFIELRLIKTRLLMEIGYTGRLSMLLCLGFAFEILWVGCMGASAVFGSFAADTFVRLV